MTNPNPYQDPASAQPWAAPPSESSAPSTAARNPLATTAFVLGMALIGLQLVNAVSQRVAIDSGDFAVVGIVGAAVSIVTALLAITAIAVGAIALARPGTSRAAAGIGVGIGIAELSAQIIWFVLGLVTSLG